MILGLVPNTWTLNIRAMENRRKQSAHFFLEHSIYLSAIETFICGREMSSIGSSSFGFAQNTIHDFQNTLLNS